MKMSPLPFISRLGMIAVAMVSTLWVLSIGGTWPALLWGGLAWIVSITLKIAWSAPTNKPILSFLKNKLPAKLSGPVSWCYTGLLTGVFGCGIALIFVQKLPILYQANWEDTLAFGVGFGAAAALVLGLLSFGGVAYYAFRPGSIPEEHKENWTQITSDTLLWMPLPVVERLSTLLIHIFTKVLIILAVQQDIYLLFWLSFGFISLVNGIAGWIRLEKDILSVTKVSQWWAYESVFIILALISLIGIMLLQRIYA